MTSLSRRTFLLQAAAMPSLCGVVSAAGEPRPRRITVHEQILELAVRQQAQRRARFAAVKTVADLEALQKDLRARFVRLLDGDPGTATAPVVHKTGTVEGDDYIIEKLIYESFPNYSVPALLYKPKKIVGRVPGILSPCGHSPVGKAADTYQIAHINLAKRGYVVLTFDPVGQGERSQFWDAEKGRSRFNLTCGEHCVLGNPLYQFGTSLAYYRIWDGMRGIDYLASLPEVDPARIGCVGNSGGGTLTAYIGALDPRVAVSVISCYITTLPRRMANRIQEDPDSDPEQDIFGFVSEGIDHAGLLALRMPKPTLICAATLDFFPIEGTRESFAEARRLYEVAGAGEKIDKVEAVAKHGFSQPLREASYAWFDRWLLGRLDDRKREIPVTPRPAAALQVTAKGQVILSHQERKFFDVAEPRLVKGLLDGPSKRTIKARDVLRLDPEDADFVLTELTGGNDRSTILVLLNGVEARDWREEKAFLGKLTGAGLAHAILDVRGTGTLRPDLQIKNHTYADSLCGVEANLAYNAFLVGKSLIGMRVADVMVAVARLRKLHPTSRIILLARRDATLVAEYALNVEPAVARIAMDDKPHFGAFGWDSEAFHAAYVLPGISRAVSTFLEGRKAVGTHLILECNIRTDARLPHMTHSNHRFVDRPDVLIDWLKKE